MSVQNHQFRPNLVQLLKATGI